MTDQRLLTGVLFAALLIAGPAAGQQQAGIIGQVTDEAGLIMPGVTVTATGPALQVPSVAGVTDERGEYRLTPLPIGTYTIEYALTGFQMVRREGVRLTVGFTARIDVSLKVGALEETITVSGAAPVVDTTSTTATTQLTRETIELLPSSRNGIVSILMQAPGVRTLRDVGGSSINQVPTYRAFGQSAEPYSTLEGVQTSSLQASGGQANYWDYTTIEEASVRTIGNSAEVPNRGVNLQAVVKSGGNAFHGSAWWNTTSADLQSDNIDEKLEAAGITSGERLNTRHSYSGDLGGRILRDKLWFYGSGRRAVDNHEPLNTLLPDGSPAIAEDVSWYHTEKLSYQMSPSNRFVGFFQYNHKYDMSSLDQFREYQFRGGLTTLSHTGKIEWQAVFGSSLVISAQYGHWQFTGIRWNFSPRDVPPSTDLITMINRGPQTDLGQRVYDKRHHPRATVSWFRPDLFKGNHEFKFGFDYTDNVYARQYPPLAVDDFHKGAPTSSIYNYRLVYNNEVPFRIEIYNDPTFPHAVSQYLGLYAQDSWTMGRRLTLNVGIRYAHDNGFVPGSCRQAANPPGDVPFPARCFDTQQFNIWNTVAGRVHAAWDIAGNGRTMIKGGWGRFDHRRQLVPELDAADPNVRSTATYQWRDLNNNRNYDPGEVNLDPTLGVGSGGDFVSQSGGSNTVPNPNEVEPTSDEFSLSIERELMANFAVRASGIYSTYRNTYRTLNLLRPYEAYNVPVTRTDPGEDGRVGTADDPGTTVTFWEYPTSLSGGRFERFTLFNDPKADQDFKSFEVAAFKRFASKWQVLASYAATKRNVPVMSSNTGSEFNSNVVSGPMTPNAEINTSDHRWEWLGKVSGAYMFPGQVMASANLEHRSGYPWARQVRYSGSTGGRTITSITLNVEPVGTRRLPNTNQLDVRVEKTFNLTTGQKVGLRMNVFNALNSNGILDLTRLSGALFMRPEAILPPRIVEFSISYSF
jgi:carboxypeptidase family protein